MLIGKKIKEEYISFDVFDTLLIRDVKKCEDIFILMEKELINTKGKKFEGFAKKRIEAAKKAQSTNKVEATLNDIYTEIGLEKSISQEVIKLEIETEKKHLHPNVLLKHWIKELKKNGKQIIITSDMYLDADTIKYFLDSYEIDYDKIYVSSNTQARKSNGKMFQYIVKDLKIKKNNIIHIGDNVKSDYLIPKIKGIKSYLWNNSKENSNHVEKLNNLKTKNSELLYKMLKKHYCTEYYEEIGYKMFGPALYGFVKWINESKEKNNLDEIIFLARDGQIVKKAYEKVYNENHPYFLASRRSLTVPLLKNANNMSEILTIVPYIKREENVSDFLKKIGIEDDSIYKKLTKKYGKVIYRKDLEGSTGKDIFDIIKEKMYENAETENGAAINYIKSNINGKKIGLVDIGWYGTMQKSLNKICDTFENDYCFYGLYFGLLEKKGNNLDASGFIYDYRERKKYDPNLIYGFNGLIELMFTANHGSSKKYILKSKKSECLLEEDQGEYSEFVRAVQNGALSFIEDIVRENTDVNLDYLESYAILEDLLKNPSKNECSILGNLQFYDAYFERIIQFEGWKSGIKNPKKMISKFLKSNWKIGFIKKMNFPFPATIYKIINKIKG